MRAPLLDSQKGLYKGINRTLINAIFDELYRIGIDGPPPTQLVCNTELQLIEYEKNGAYSLTLYQEETKHLRMCNYDSVIIASGYGYQEPAFLKGIDQRIRRDEQGQFSVCRNYSIDSLCKEIFVQNAELHTHGLSAPDLTMACHRNSIILSEILGYSPYPIEQKVAFQTFGIFEAPNQALAWA